MSIFIPNKWLIFLITENNLIKFFEVSEANLQRPD